MCFKHYQDILRDYIDPSTADLPSIKCKSKSLSNISNKMLKEKLPILYRYVPVSEYSIKSLLDQSVYLVSANEMNDSFEGALSSNSLCKTLTAQNQNLQSQIYLKCFSLTYDNILMWSHYADANKGFCIGYDFNKANCKIKSHLYPVQYSNIRLKSNDVRQIESHPFFYLRKSLCWKYEREFRLIYESHEIAQSGNNLQLGCISEIYFGLRMDPAIKKEIELIVRDLNHKKGQAGQIKLYNIEQDKNSFLLRRNKY